MGYEPQDEKSRARQAACREAGRQAWDAAAKESAGWFAEREAELGRPLTHDEWMEVYLSQVAYVMGAEFAGSTEELWRQFDRPPDAVLDIKTRADMTGAINRFLQPRP